MLRRSYIQSVPNATAEPFCRAAMLLLALRLLLLLLLDVSEEKGLAPDAGQTTRFLDHPTCTRTTIPTELP